MKYEQAPDIQEIAEDVITIMGWHHLISARVICIRSYGAKANIYARIWAFPKIWQIALDISPFYVIEFPSEKFDKLDKKEKIKTVIHELLHIPKKFSGGLVSHSQGSINRFTESRLYDEYLKRKEKFSN